MYKILSIDGGGIRGVIPGVLLQYIEEKTGNSISNTFDLIVGTSTGGILAAGLTVPGKGNFPKFSAEDMVSLYTDFGGEIFGRSLWRKVSSGAGSIDEKYSHKNLERLLTERLGKKTLKDCLKPIVLTSYDIERREPYFFKSSRAKKHTTRNHYLADAARATSAAPTYFEPAKVMSLSKNPVRRALVDGGIFANNPSVCAYVEAIRQKGPNDEILMVSLGTGVATRKIAYEDAVDWGALGWARPAISAMMDGVSDVADYQMEQLLAGKTNGKNQRYFRFDIELLMASDDLDNARAGNIQNLKDEAARIVEKQDMEFKRLFKLL